MCNLPSLSLANTTSKRFPHSNPLKSLPYGHLCLIVMIDQLSKFPVVEVPRNTLTNLINNFLQRTITTFSMPQTTISDNSLPFQLYHVKDLFTKLKIKHQIITPLWPQANAPPDPLRNI